jgi:hypothetical protein
MKPAYANPPTNQSAIDYSSRLGELAAMFPTVPLQPHPARKANPAMSPLAEILAHLGQRPTAKEEAARTLRANEMLVGD